MECDRRPNVLCWDGVPTITTTTASTTSGETTTEAQEEETTTTATSTTSGETTATEGPEEETTETESEAPPTTAGPPNFTDMCRGIVVDLLAHPTDCTQFVVCVLGRYTLEQCGENQIFYPQIRVCGYGNPEEC
ncbi:endochitinase-like [Ochlerotatus camptorhynchus]|uniref:endochitinase-like n=1 Tax=Ochlerotatus camptorhynchus TaxID=644619 RepID=UPI0031D4032D